MRWSEERCRGQRPKAPQPPADRLILHPEGRFRAGRAEPARPTDPAGRTRIARTSAICDPLPVFPFSCPTAIDPRTAWSQHQAHKLRLLTAWRDATERRLAALNAAISTLQQQIARDSAAAE